MFKRNLVHVWVGIVLLSGMFLMGQETWPPALVPTISSISPPDALPGEVVTISGAYFGQAQDSSTVTFNTLNAGTINSWTDQKILVIVPEGAVTGPVFVTVSGKPSNTFSFGVVEPPQTNLEEATTALETHNFEVFLDLVPAYEKETMTTKLGLVNDEFIQSLSDSIRNATLIEEKRGYRKYEVDFVLSDGTPHSTTFEMILIEGEWKLSGL